MSPIHTTAAVVPNAGRSSRARGRASAAVPVVAVTGTAAGAGIQRGPRKQGWCFVHHVGHNSAACRFMKQYPIGPLPGEFSVSERKATEAENLPSYDPVRHP